MLIQNVFSACSKRTYFQQIYASQPTLNYVWEANMKNLKQNIAEDVNCKNALLRSPRQVEENLNALPDF